MLFRSQLQSTSKPDHLHIHLRHQGTGGSTAICNWMYLREVVLGERLEQVAQIGGLRGIAQKRRHSEYFLQGA